MALKLSQKYNGIMQGKIDIVTLPYTHVKAGLSGYAYMWLNFKKERRSQSPYPGFSPLNKLRIRCRDKKFLWIFAPPGVVHELNPEQGGSRTCQIIWNTVLQVFDDLLRDFLGQGAVNHLIFLGRFWLWTLPVCGANDRSNSSVDSKTFNGNRITFSRMNN